MSSRVAMASRVVQSQLILPRPWPDHAIPAAHSAGHPFIGLGILKRLEPLGPGSCASGRPYCTAGSNWPANRAEANLSLLSHEQPVLPS